MNVNPKNLCLSISLCIAFGNLYGVQESNSLTANTGIQTPQTQRQERIQRTLTEALRLAAERRRIRQIQEAQLTGTRPLETRTFSQPQTPAQQRARQASQQMMAAIDRRSETLHDAHYNPTPAVENAD